MTTIHWQATLIEQTFEATQRGWTYRFVESDVGVRVYRILGYKPLWQFNDQNSTECQVFDTNTQSFVARCDADSNIYFDSLADAYADVGAFIEKENE